MITEILSITILTSNYFITEILSITILTSNYFITEIPSITILTIPSSLTQRFEHSNRLHKKISTFISFPEHLDMSPYMSSRRNNNNNNHNNGISHHNGDVNNRYVIPVMVGGGIN